MIKVSLIYLLTTSVVMSCPNTVYYGSPCPQHPLDVYAGGLSIYDDYNDKKCTKPLLEGGVCPDYLQGGCANTWSCDYDKRATFDYIRAPL
jgi:hypothetical protein